MGMMPIRQISDEERYVCLVVDECHKQDATSPEEVARFMAAYMIAMNSGAMISLHVIGQMAETIVPMTGSGYRRVAAHFSDPTDFAMRPDVIQDAMASLVVTWNSEENQDCSRINPIQFYTEFEKIHPFTDGNGRVGHLLWKMCLERSFASQADEYGWTDDRLLDQIRAVWLGAGPPDVSGGE